MNTRDPFNRHRAIAFDILRGTTINAARATRQIIEAGSQVYDQSKQAVEEMSFSVPNNVPSFSNPNRESENRPWGASGVTARSAASHSNGGVMSGVQDRVGGFFEKGRGDLPMYKDKPYSYAASRRIRSTWRQKRTWGVLGVFGFLVLYFMGFFGGHSAAPEKSKAASGWSWLGKSEKASSVDWLDRRERVKEAFTLSWDAYERYAWGMSTTIWY
jgi:endoplasmic reticulum Man9GlcNAc2 1,2-alpha-mannosidase